MNSGVFVGRLFLLVCCFAPGAVQPLTQAELDNMAAKLELRYDVIDNLVGGGSYKARLTLMNKGSSVIRKGDWAIYFCSIRLVEPNKATASSTEKYGVRFSHVNGCFHKMKPIETFKDLAAGDKLVVNFKAQHWVVAKTDIMPNWFIAAPGFEAKIVASTAGESLSFVGDFTTKEQWKRFVGDLYDPYTARKRYDVIGIENLGDKDTLLVIPQPVAISGLDRNTRMALTKDWKVYADSGLKKEAQFLAAKFRASVVTSPPSDQTKVIRLILGDPDVTINGNKSTNPEAYSLEVGVSSQLVKVTGRGAAGVFYGIQTLLALGNKENTVPQVTIKDTPRYGYRGMHLDVGRNFMPKSAVLKLLDAMAMYKLNKFHFHLTDDEGWRLEIPGLEELTTVGSKRCYDPTGKKCILTQLGSAPAEPTAAFYYTVADYKEILQRANDLHIQVIPEFDMPGHGYAAIKAMEARYQNLKATDLANAKKYLLAELGDPSKYLSIQYFTDDAINPCIESTYTFIEHVVKAVVRMHNDTQPLTIYHFGGDEVAHGAWTNSSACRQLAQRLGLNFSGSDIVDKLKDHFVQRVANITNNNGLNLGGWEDGLLGAGDVPYDRSFISNPEVYAYAWNNIWDWGGGKRAYMLANAGYKVIMTQATHLYFDFPYEPDPEERGYYWATRFTDTRKTFGFMPDNLFNNVELKRSGAPYSREELCKTIDMCVALQHKDNIIGVAGALWTETVRTADQMDSMIFPRLLALAERAWHNAPWEDIDDKIERNNKRTEDWQNFANFLGHQELARLDKKGIKYHLPPPGASIAHDGSHIKVKTAQPGLPVQYSDDGGKTWHDVTDETQLSGKVKLATRSADRTRLSRLVEVQVSPKAIASTALINVALVLLCIQISLMCFT